MNRPRAIVIPGPSSSAASETTSSVRPEGRDPDRPRCPRGAAKWPGVTEDFGGAARCARTRESQLEVGAAATVPVTVTTGARADSMATRVSLAMNLATERAPPPGSGPPGPAATRSSLGEIGRPPQAPPNARASQARAPAEGAGWPPAFGITGYWMPDFDHLPDWEKLLAAERHIQQIVPGSVMVGGQPPRCTLGIGKASTAITLSVTCAPALTRSWPIWRRLQAGRPTVFNARY